MATNTDSEQPNGKFFGGDTTYQAAHRLLRSANSQLINPASVRLRQITTTYHEKLKSCQDNLNRQKEVANQILIAVTQNRSAAKTLISDKKLYSPHTGTDNASIDSSSSSHYLRDSSSAHLGSDQLIPEAERNLENAKYMLERMSKLKIPANRLWPDDGGQGCALTIGTLIVGIIGSSVGGFGGFLFFSGLFYSALMVLRYRIPAQQLVEEYGKLQRYLRNAELLAQKELEMVDRKTADPLAQAESDYKSALEDLHRQLLPAAANQATRFDQLKSETKYGGADWSDEMWDQWEPASSHSCGASFGTLKSITENISDAFADLALPLAIPALSPFSDGRGLVIVSPSSHRESAINSVQSLITRLLATIPPGKAFFTFIDPIGLGTQVAPFMQLAEYEKSLVNSQAWTDSTHIDKRLSEITETMETLIQKRLQGRYHSIYDYNQVAEVKEPLRFLFILDFPSSFTDSSFRRLVSIARNGPRCGVYLVVVQDKDKPMPYGCNSHELEEFCELLLPGPESTFYSPNEPFIYEERSIWTVRCDSPPPQDLLSKIITLTGEHAKEGMKVEVPFDKLLEIASLSEPDWRNTNRTTAAGLEVPLGPTNDRRPQQLSLGSGTAHHGLIVGRTGSGKSNLMHVIITGLAWKYSPDEIKLYLLDFKKGVEFEPYARYKLPHAGAIAVESEREFAISVIEQLDSEMEKRDPLFKDAGVSNLSEYRSRLPEAIMPRILLLIDEFQELFAIEDALSRKAAMLLNRIVLQGRSFGLHVMLGTQTLKRAMDLTSATYDQMAVRIALQCSDADSRLILADDNSAARLLSRPGEAIYNDSAGLLEGNSSFQVARFDDRDRIDWLEKIRNLASSHSTNGVAPEPIVFDGRNMAQLDRCKPLNESLLAPEWQPFAKYCDLFLGEPIAIQPPISARLRRQSGSNLLVITRNETEGLGILTAAATSLLCSLAPRRVRLGIFNFASSDESYAMYPNLLAEMFPDRVSVWSRQRDVPSVLDKLATLSLGRSEGAPSSETFVLFIVGLHRIRALRDSYESDDEKRPVENLRTILKEGPESGIHVVSWSDTWPNARAHLDDRLYTEFSMRVAGMMNADDSRWFIDDDCAGKLDKNRCVFYDEDVQGKPMKFRPYGLPDKSWLQATSAALAKRTSPL